MEKIEADVVVIGGGCAGLWLLDALRRQGFRTILLESNCLGGGQTTASQGILHGGVKYSLRGVFSAAANAVKEMPGIWRNSLTGHTQPDLTGVRIRSQHCHLWRSDSWQSWAGLIGARTFLEVKPTVLDAADRPPILAACPGQVFLLEEQVIDTISFTEVLAQRHSDFILKSDSDRAIEFTMNPAGAVTQVQIHEPQADRVLAIQTKFVVLAAGAGNQALRQAMGRSVDAMQLRPLHMVLVRGDLPRLNGHCVDGAKTRVTVTSDTDSTGRMVWQVGGQIAEDGVEMTPKALIKLARSELTSVLPGWSPGPLEWSTYRVDRAEAKMAAGTRPDDVQLLQESNALTIWPTKLVLAPRMADRVIECLGSPAGADCNVFLTSIQQLNWPAPAVAIPPWERQVSWMKDDSDETVRS